MRMRSIGVWAVIAGVAVAGVVVVAVGPGSERTERPTDVPEAAAQQPVGPTEEHPAPWQAGDDLEPWERDALYIGEARGISPEQALQEGKWQTLADDTIGGLRSVARHRLAGTWVEYEPSWRVVAAYTGPDDLELEAAHAIGIHAPVPVEIRTGAAVTEAQLSEAARAARGSLNEAGVAGSGPMPQEGLVLIEVMAEGEYAADPSALARQLEAEFGVPFRITVVDVRDELLTNAYGG